MKFYTDYFIEKNQCVVALGVRTCIVYLRNRKKGNATRKVRWGIQGRDVTLGKLIIHASLAH